MPPGKDSVELIYNFWERFLNAQDAFFGGDRELTELSNKMDQLRAKVYTDNEVSEAELGHLLKTMEAAAELYTKLAARKGISLDASLPTTRESFRVFQEAAEIHFQTLAGDASQHFRGGLLRQLLNAADPDTVVQRIVLDLLTSASTPIAIGKVHLLRAELTELGDGERQRKMLERTRDRLSAELARPVWRVKERRPAITPQQFDEDCRFESAVAVRRVELPSEVRGDNRMLANRPLPGRDSANRAAVRSLLEDLRSAGRLFLDKIANTEYPIRVAAKLDLNLGIEGAPSVTDPAATYAVVAELLVLGEARNLALTFSVGDSNGIENAPIGRTSLDVMRETGNYHAALKAALEFGARPSVTESLRTWAQVNLDRLLSLERSSPPVYFGSADDHISSPEDLSAAEDAASPWVVCVDFDQAGYRAVDTELGPLGRAIRGSKDFHIAEPWVAADYRVHISRGVSNHTFAGWTGATKGLVGLHALGGRPADLGMTLRGQSPLDVLAGVMQSGGFTGLLARRGCVPDWSRLVSKSEDAVCRSAVEKSTGSWSGLSRFAAGRKIWADTARQLERELRRDEDAGVPMIDIMAKMRRTMAACLAEAELASPGFRAALMEGVVDGTRAFLLTLWTMRELIPPEMRDESIGLRIGLLSRLPLRADLVIQGLPKIGLGGGPDSYFDVRDVGIALAGTDEISVDLTALRLAGVDGNPWSYNHPIHGALQLGTGPTCWEEIRDISTGE